MSIFRSNRCIFKKLELDEGGELDEEGAHPRVQLAQLSEETKDEIPKDSEEEYKKIINLFRTNHEPQIVLSITTLEEKLKSFPAAGKSIDFAEACVLNTETGSLLGGITYNSMFFLVHQNFAKRHPLVKRFQNDPNQSFFKLVRRFEVFLEKAYPKFLEVRRQIFDMFESVLKNELKKRGLNGYMVSHKIQKKPADTTIGNTKVDSETHFFIIKKDGNEVAKIKLWSLPGSNPFLVYYSAEKQSNSIELNGGESPEKLFNFVFTE